MQNCVIVVPCYREATRLPTSEFRAFFERHPDVEFCFVDDGSDDRTFEVIEELTETVPQATCLRLEENRGKSEAVRRGILHVLETEPGPSLVGYWDADLSTPLTELPRVVSPFEDPAVMMAWGCRLRRLGSKIERRPYRHVLGRLFATVVSFVLGVPVYDTQCGAKILRSSLASEVFGTEFGSRWIFDVELLARVIDSLEPEEVGRALVEVPLTRWSDVKGSRLHVLDFLRAPMELLHIWWSYRRHA